MKKTLMSLAVMIAILVSPAISKAELIESTKPYDYKNGLLDDENLVLKKDFLTSDNDLTTYEKFNSATPDPNIANGVYMFKYPVNLTGMFYKIDNAVTDLVIRFFNGSTTTLSIQKGNFEEYIELDYKNVTSITWQKKSSVGATVKIYEIDFFGSYESSMKFYDKPSGISSSSTFNSIDLSWINPNLIGFENVLLYVNGELKDTLGTDVTSYQLTNLTPETSYQIELVAKYDDGGLSEKEILTVVTPKIEPEKKEIQNLNAKATHERVDLSWQLPVYQDTFKYVNIYRGLADEDFDRYTLNTVKPSSKTIKKIFETNGTYFNDLTVEPATTYDYKLSVTETNNNETEGILTRVTTAEKPTPEIKNPVISKEGDDYIVTWTNEEGKVKIDVDGKTYKEVEASTKKLIIPAADMKYDMFGKPLITITYTDKYGESSQPSKPSTSGPGFEDKELKLPFTIGTFLKVVMDLILIVGPFLLLALAIRFTPNIIDLIKKANNKGGKK